MKYTWKYFKNRKPIKFTWEDVMARMDSLINENNKLINKLKSL